ncbi:MAG: flavin reductase family protein [Candidatus Omnitrophota bacterium]
MAAIPNRLFSVMLSSHPILLLSARSGRFNTISTVSCYLPLSQDPPMIGLSLKPSSMSYRYIRESGDFILGVPDESMLQIVHFCGVNSGRYLDKISHLNLPTTRGKSASPLLLTSCPANIECRVRDIVPIGNRPFLNAEILDITADSRYYGNGWLPGVRLIHFEGGTRYRIGNEIVDMGSLRPGLIQMDSIG